MDWKELIKQRAAEAVYIKKLEDEYGITLKGGVNNDETDETYGNAAAGNSD